MEIKECISRLKKFYHSFLQFIDNGIDTSDSIEQIKKFIKDNHFGENPDELRSILHIIYKISSQRKRNPVLMNKVQQILLFLEIKRTFSNNEIYRIFKKDKFLLLFLFNHKIITIDEKIFTLLLENHGRYFSNFFYPEIKPFLEANKQNGKTVLFENSQVYCDDFEEKRQKGENDSELCQLIRNDSLDEFISAYNDQQLKPLSSIPRSIFETNIYLSKSGINLIDYAAFFGSFKILSFLLNDNKELPPTLLNSVIRSGNIEIIHFLEEMKIEALNHLNERYIIEALKCHQNSIAHYIINNLFGNKNENKFVEECFDYYNFEFFPDDLTENFESIFEYACHYDYVTIVKILLNENKIDMSIAILKIFKFKIKFSIFLFF